MTFAQSGTDSCAALAYCVSKRRAADPAQSPDCRTARPSPMRLLFHTYADFYIYVE